MLPNEKPDFKDWTDKELAEELDYLDRLTASHQAEIVRARKALNSSMELREEVYDLIKKRSSKKGWTR